MAEGGTTERMVIGHVMFIDIVGYSKLLLNEQRAALAELNSIAQSTEQFRRANQTGELIRLPTGDGMALVFRDSPESPVECAVEIARGYRSLGKFSPVRIGVHSGPVGEIVDVAERKNVAGAGINIAQRVMDCGDAGHILISKHVAEDLEHDERWSGLLQDLGECEVKHGVRISLTNLVGSDFGNPALPGKVAAFRKVGERGRRQHRLIVTGVILVVALAAAAFALWRTIRAPLGDAALSTLPAKSIAVLPFENLSADPSNAYFADGMQDEVLTDLAKIADLKVISRTSVMPFKPGINRDVRAIA